MDHLAVLSKQVQRFEGKLNICTGYIISREKTFKLKIALNNINLGLCDSRDYFASPLLIVQTD